MLHRLVGGAIGLYGGVLWGPSEIAITSKRGTISVVGPHGQSFRVLALGKQLLRNGAGAVRLLGWAGNGRSVVASIACTGGFECTDRIVSIDDDSGQVRGARSLEPQIAVSGTEFEISAIDPVSLSRDGSVALAQQVVFSLDLSRKRPRPKLKARVVQVALSGTAPPKVLVGEGATPDWNL